MRGGVLLLGLALLLPGCLDPSPARPQDPAPPAGPWATVAFPTCHDQTGRFPTPMADASVPAPLLPTPFDPAGAFAETFVLATDCEGARMMLLATRVLVPEAWKPEHIEFTLFVHDVWTDDALWSGFFTDTGAPLQQAPVQFDVSAGPVRTGHAEGPFAFDVEGANEDGWPQEDVRFFHAGDATMLATDWDLGPGSQMRGSARLSDGRIGLGGHFWGDERHYVLVNATLPALA